MSEKEVVANPEAQTLASEEDAKLKADDASQNLLADAQTSEEQPVTSAKVDASVAATTKGGHDLEALILGGPLGWGVYRENQNELDPAIDACQRFAMEVNMLPLRTVQRMAENSVNKPLTTALEFLAFPGIPALHASLSVINDRLRS